MVVAGEIFVGSVAVGVVPDLRGFNDRLRAELVPMSDKIGKDIGKRISDGIKANIDLGDIISKASTKALPKYRAAGRLLGDEFGKAFRAGLDARLRDPFKAKIKLDTDTLDKDIASIRRKITSNLVLGGLFGAGGGGGGGAGQQLTDRQIADLIDALRGRGAAGRGGGGGGILGFLSSFRGGGQTPIGALGALSGPQAAGVAAGVAAAAPFAGQVLGGGLIGALGLGLTGLGIYGALSGTTGTQTTPGQLNVAQLRLRAAQLRLAQLQAGTTTTRTTAPATPLSIIAAQDRLSAAQDRLNTLQSSGKTTAAQLASGYASVAGAQNTLNNLQARGATTTTHHAASAAQLASAQASVAAAQQRLNTLQANAPDISKAQAKMHAAWVNLQSDAQDSIRVIGASFAPVLQDIFNQADKVLLKMTPVFAKAEGVISKPFQRMADTIIKAFGSPQVQKSIGAVASAFGKILDAFTPDIPGIMNSVADAITRIADAVAKNPKAFADMANFLAQIIIGVLNLIAYLTYAADWLEQSFGPTVARWSEKFWHGIRDQWKLFTGDIGRIWGYFWRDIIARLANSQNFTTRLTSGWYHNIVHWFDLLRHDVAFVWDLMWNNTIGRLMRGVADSQRITAEWEHNIAHEWDVLRHDTAAAFSDAIHWLENAGRDIVKGLFNGIDNEMKNIGSWVKTHIVDPVVNNVKHFFGIHSPSTVMAGIGSNLIAGLLKGIFTSTHDLSHFIKNVFGGMPAALGHMIEKGLVDITKIPQRVLAKLGDAFKSIGGFFAKALGFGGTSGVSQWSGTVIQALAMLGLPSSLLGQVLYQMQTESGGNVNAINLTDINAQAGDPSRGLMQVIGSTFAAYHVPGTSGNIYDPLANIAAALNYAMHVYGPTLMRGGMGIGSGHGYDTGGWLPPGTSIAYNLTGRPERILSHAELAKWTRGGDGATYHAHFDGLTGAAIESHVRTAFHAMQLTDGQLSRQGRRI